MISINGVTLSNDLILDGEFDEAEVSLSVTHTLGGRPVFDAMALEGGLTYTLSATGDGGRYSGYFTRAQVVELQALRTSAATVVFIHESKTLSIKVLDVKVRPNVARPNQVDADEYVGSVTIITV